MDKDYFTFTRNFQVLVEINRLKVKKINKLDLLASLHILFGISLTMTIANQLSRSFTKWTTELTDNGAFLSNHCNYT
jgi:hypothetical protein